jgi:hypothetical protein
METWANAALPALKTTSVAYNATRLRAIFTSPRFPPNSTHPTLLQASDVQTKVIEDAHWAASSYTFITATTEIGVDAAERAELVANCLRTPPVDGTLPARGLAVTVLVNTANFRRLDELADALAVLSGGVEDRVPARAVRFAVALDGVARSYCSKHAAGAASRPSFLASDATLEICVSCGSNDGGGCEVAIKSTFRPVKFQSTPFGMFQNIVKSVASAVTEHASFREGAFSSYGSVTADHLVSAHSKHLERTSLKFWGMLKIATPEVLSECASVSEDFLLTFGERPRAFLRIVPKGAALNGERAHLGILFHERGKDELVEAFLNATTADELAKSQDPHPIVGLRPPQTPNEQALGLHVLCVHGDEVDLSAMLTTFGTLSVPGRSLGARGARVPRLTARFVPLDDRICEHFYVLPCRQNGVDVAGVRQLNESQWIEAEHFLSSYEHLFKTMSGDEVAEEMQQSMKFAVPASSSEAPSTPDLMLSAMLGVPLSSPALAIGDALESVVARNESVALATFLGEGIAQLGPSASVSEWFSAAASDAKRARLENNALRKRLKICEDERDAANAKNTEAVAETAKVAVEVEAEEKLEGVEVSEKVVDCVLAGFGRAQISAWLMKAPLSKKCTKAIILAHAKSVATDDGTGPLCERTVEWAKRTFVLSDWSGTHLETVCQILARLYRTKQHVNGLPIVLISTNGEITSFHLFNENANGTLLTINQLVGYQTATLLKFNTVTLKLSAVRSVKASVSG